MEKSPYRRAVEMNDEAHRKSIIEVDDEDFEERQKRFAEINAEAKMWLRELFANHKAHGTL